MRFVGARGWIVSIECALRPLASHKKIQEKLLWRQSGIVIYHEYATLVNWDYHLILIKRHQKILLQNLIPQAVHRWIGCSPFSLYFCYRRAFFTERGTGHVDTENSDELVHHFGYWLCYVNSSKYCSYSWTIYHWCLWWSTSQNLAPGSKFSLLVVLCLS